MFRWVILWPHFVAEFRLDQLQKTHAHLLSKVVTFFTFLVRQCKTMLSKLNHTKITDPEQECMECMKDNNYSKQMCRLNCCL